MNTTRTCPKALAVSWGGYYAVVSYVDGKTIVHAERFRSLDTARRSADRHNAKSTTKNALRAKTAP
jgi:hypothetical protein